MWRRPTGRTRPSFVNYCCWGEGGGKQGNQTLRVQPKLPRRQTNISQCMPFIYAIYYFFPRIGFSLLSYDDKRVVVCWWGCVAMTSAQQNPSHITHYKSHTHTHTYNIFIVGWCVYIVFFPCWWFSFVSYDDKRVVVCWWGCVATTSSQQNPSHITHYTSHTHIISRTKISID